MGELGGTRMKCRFCNLLSGYQVSVKFWPNRKQYPTVHAVTLPLEVYVCSDHSSSIILDDVYPHALRAATTLSMTQKGLAPPDWTTARLFVAEVPQPAMKFG